jgi:hypothetical protein
LATFSAWLWTWISHLVGIISAISLQLPQPYRIQALLKRQCSSLVRFVLEIIFMVRSLDSDSDLRQPDWDDTKCFICF